MAKKKELVKKETAELVVQSETGSMGASDSFDSEDILIPKIMLVQDKAQWVEDNVAKAGDYLNSLTEESMGDKDSVPLKFIAFAKYKTLQIRHDGNWKETQDWHPSMRALPYEEMVDGVKVNNLATINYLGFLAGEVTEVDDGVFMAMPYCIQFKGGSAMAGKSYDTALNNLKMFKKPSWFKVFDISAVRAKNKDNKSFYKWIVKQAETATEAQQKAAMMLCEQYNANKEAYKVDDKDDSETPETVNTTETATADAKKNIKF